MLLRNGQSNEDYEQARDMIVMAIRETLPGINEDNYKEYLFSTYEIENILAYIKSICLLGKRKKAAELEKNGVRYISIQNSRYPYLLKNTYDPPWGLYVKGELPSDDNLFISIVGSRKCSDYIFQASRSAFYEMGR